jgi:NADH-quinone oxidoreductase subunit M
LATPLPNMMSFFLFICLSSLALPMLNGFVGEFLILVGVFEQHAAWAAWATSGAVLSAIYLLWMYQRVALGEVTVERNNELADATPREKTILVVVSVMALFMGVASPLFTHRMQPSAENLLHQMDRPHPSGPVLATRPITAPITAPIAAPSAPAPASGRATAHRGGAAVANVSATVLEKAP